VQVSPNNNELTISPFELAIDLKGAHDCKQIR
jgi:hypothetical protein